MTDVANRVLIVGAGPVGLWLAGELSLAGVETTVLERTETRSPFTRGLGIHARTVEVLAMRGAASVPLAAGRRMPAWHFGMLPNLLDFSVLDSEYPFVLAYPQQLLEQLLERRAVELGATVLRGHTVTAVTQGSAGGSHDDGSSHSGDDAGSVTVTASVAPDGRIATFRAAFVVGCDGAGSTVRKAAGIAFPGTDSTLFGYVADATLDAPPERSAISVVSPGGALVVAPLPDGRFRVAGFDPADQVPTDQSSADQDPAGADRAAASAGQRLRASVARATGGGDFGLRDVTWFSRFGNASRQAERYRAGRVLLAGDAAHMHFPTGGVGLNVGIQDAMNLGWKLAAVVQDRAPLALLDSYHDERHPVGAALLQNTLAQTALIVSFTPEGLALRTYLSGLLAELSARLAGELSGLDIAYPAADPQAHPLTGHRVPDLRVGAVQPDAAAEPGLSDRLYPTMGDARAVLLDFAGNASGTGTGPRSGTVSPLADGPVAAHAARLGIAVRAAEPWPGRQETAAALIRPDGYVAWATDQPADHAAVGAALTGFGVRFDPALAAAE